MRQRRAPCRTAQSIEKRNTAQPWPDPAFYPSHKLFEYLLLGEDYSGKESFKMTTGGYGGGVGVSPEPP